MRDKPSRILLACMPKSGSTYLSRMLAMLPNSAITSWVPDYGRREQELCHERLMADSGSTLNLVAQHHVRYSDVTARYISEFGLMPVVLVRNIFDVVPSLIDHHKQESTVYPAAFVPDDIVQWEFERAARFVTQMVLPWYFNFFVSWQLCSDNKLIVSYENLMRNPLEEMEKISAFGSFDFESQDIANAIARAASFPIRKNVGISGRGMALPEAEKELIREMASYYPGVDFSLIGL